MNCWTRVRLDRGFDSAWGSTEFGDSSVQTWSRGFGKINRYAYSERSQTQRWSRSATTLPSSRARATSRTASTRHKARSTCSPAISTGRSAEPKSRCGSIANAFRALWRRFCSRRGRANDRAIVGAAEWTAWMGGRQKVAIRPTGCDAGRKSNEIDHVDGCHALHAAWAVQPELRRALVFGTTTGTRPSTRPQAARRCAIFPSPGPSSRGTSRRDFLSQIQQSWRNWRLPFVAAIAARTARMSRDCDRTREMFSKCSIGFV